jgi:hypothetical protein
VAPLPSEGGDANGIEDLESPAAASPQGIFTLQGVRVSEIVEPGIYIINGKKYLHKR